MKESVERVKKEGACEELSRLVKIMKYQECCESNEMD